MKRKFAEIEDKTISFDVIQGKRTTLLKRFINDKYGSYVEPQRKGTPKGDPIGLSKKKYHASLLVIINTKKKEIAKRVDVSYKLLRKWNTEELFKKAITSHCEEFAILAFERLRNTYRSKSRNEYKLCKGEVNESKKLSMNLKDFSDVDLYSSRLKNAIMDLVGLNIHDYEDAQTALYIQQVIRFSEPNELENVVFATLMRMSMDMVKILGKKGLSDADREELNKINSVFTHFLSNLKDKTKS